MTGRATVARALAILAPILYVALGAYVFVGLLRPDVVVAAVALVGLVPLLVLARGVRDLEPKLRLLSIAMATLFVLSGLGMAWVLGSGVVDNLLALSALLAGVAAAAALLASATTPDTDLLATRIGMAAAATLLAAHLAVQHPVVWPVTVGPWAIGAMLFVARLLLWHDAAAPPDTERQAAAAEPTEPMEP